MNVRYYLHNACRITKSSSYATATKIDDTEVDFSFVTREKHIKSIHQTYVLATNVNFKKRITVKYNDFRFIKFYEKLKKKLYYFLFDFLFWSFILVIETVTKIEKKFCSK